MSSGRWKKIRKIVISFATVLLLGSGIIAATNAYFTDSLEMRGVTFSTGNADLQLAPASLSLWLAGDATAADLGVGFPSSLYPGYEGSWSAPDGVIYLGNFSTAPINLVVSAKIADYSSATVDLADNVLLAMAWGGLCDPGGVGTGFQTLSWWQSNSATLFTGADPSCSYLSNDHSGGYAGYARALKFFLKIPTTAGNDIVDSSATFNIHFDAEQRPQ